jgi:hypothetical protein
MASTILYQAREYDDGDEITCRATSPVNLGHLVMISGDRDSTGSLSAAHAPAGGLVLGVAGSDAPAGEVFTSYGAPGQVVRVVAANAIVAGAKVEVAAGGTVQTANTGTVIGYTLAAVLGGAMASVRLI